MSKSHPDSTRACFNPIQPYKPKLPQDKYEGPRIQFRPFKKKLLNPMCKPQIHSKTNPNSY